MSSEEEFQEALKNVSDGLLRVFIKRTEGKFAWTPYFLHTLCKSFSLFSVSIAI